MDDVLSKPLSVPALTAMIKKFWDAPDEEAQEAPAADLHKADAVLDTDMLEQYIELVGPKLINDGLAVFEKMMPGYMSVLESNLTARDQKGIVEEGHKIKGAAGSIGLRHIQQLGQQIQTPDLPAWSDNVAEWVEEMKSEWQNDVAVLKAWVAKASKNDPDRPGCANTAPTPGNWWLSQCCLSDVVTWRNRRSGLLAH